MALESIALIPSGYKATKVYSQLPVNGNGDFTFDRGTSADQTRVNKNGLIESVAQDVPRLDYLDGGCPSLLLEPASTNLVTYSEDFSNVAWTTLGSVTTNTDAVLSPDGSVNADEIVSVATGTRQGKLDGVSATSGLDYTFSVFVKYKDAQYVQLVIGGLGFGGTDYANFDIQNGVIGDEGVSDSAKIVDYGSGWYRISLTATATSTNAGSGSVTFIDSSTASRNATFSGTIGSGVYLFGGQLEEQSYATSYMPSLLGVSGVRDAETCNGAGTTAEINSQEGVLFMEYKPSVDSANKQVTLSDGTTTERITIEVRNSGGAFRFYSQNSTNSNISNDFSILDNDVYYKVAYQYSTTSLKIYVNGLLFDEITGTIYLPSGLNELALDTGTGILPLLGRTKKVSVYDQALSTTELETLTGFTSFAEMATYLSYS